MKIIEPSVQLVDSINADDIYRKIELCGRVCYQSALKGKPEQFIRMLIKKGHESVLEHVSLTFHIICDRAIQNELVRHRLASFSVESTRYVKYHELTFVKPFFWNGDNQDAWENFCRSVEGYYLNFLKDATPEQARSLLSLCLKSELFMTANLREWRHILKLRTSEHAHPQMRQIARMILQIFRDKLPVIVEDLGGFQNEI